MPETPTFANRAVAAAKTRIGTPKNPMSCLWRIRGEYSPPLVLDVLPRSSVNNSHVETFVAAGCFVHHFASVPLTPLHHRCRTPRAGSRQIPPHGGRDYRPRRSCEDR